MPASSSSSGLCAALFLHLREKRKTISARERAGRKRLVRRRARGVFFLYIDDGKNDTGIKKARDAGEKRRKDLYSGMSILPIGLF